MKKTLCSTTALAAAGLLTLGAGQAFAQAAAPAMAEKLKINVGGFMHQMIGVATQKSKYEGTVNPSGGYKTFGQKSDSEIYFSGSVKLDSGITVGVMAQLEGDNAGGTSTNNWDETYMSVAGDFGTVYAGSGKSASFKLGVSAPSVGALNPYNGDEAAWVIKPSSTAGVGSSTFSGADDTNRIVYVSPSFGGFRVGGSYSPSSVSSSTQALTSETDVTDISVQYAGKAGDIGFRVYAGYWNTQGGSTSQTDTYSGGADITIAGFTIGGGYSDQSPDTNGNANTVSMTDQQNWNAGVKYVAGPMGVSFNYAASKGEDTRAVAADDKHTRYTLGASYDLGPGVELLGSAIYNRTKDQSSAVSLENSGYALVGGIKVSF